LEFSGIGPEGGEYVSPFGQAKVVDIGRRVLIKLPQRHSLSDFKPAQLDRTIPCQRLGRVMYSTLLSQLDEYVKRVSAQVRPMIQRVDQRKLARWRTPGCEKVRANARGILWRNLVRGFLRR
jgi:hypothetical protein